MRRAGQKGMTLVEVLAALLFFGLMIGVGIIVMVQAGSFTKTTTMRELDDMAADGATRMLRRALTQASEIYYQSESELRYRQNVRYYALRFEPDPADAGSMTITRYRLPDDAYAEFTDPDVSRETHAGLYTEPLRIGDGLRRLEVLREDESSPGDFVPMAVSEGRAAGNIALHLTFGKRRNPAGTSETVVTDGQVRRLVIDLMYDDF